MSKITKQFKDMLEIEQGEATHEQCLQDARKRRDDTFTKEVKFFGSLFAFVAVLVLGGGAGAMSLQNSTDLQILKATGQVIGHTIDASISSYSTFGSNGSGDIVLLNQAEEDSVEFTDLATKVNMGFSPMIKSSGSNQMQIRKKTIYGSVVTKDGKPGEGVGVIPLEFDASDNLSGVTLKLTSGNYGTKASQNDLSWCFVLHSGRQYMKFTQKVKEYPHSITPLTCVNGN